LRSWTILLNSRFFCMILTYVWSKSYKSSETRFYYKYPGVLASSAIFELVNKVRWTGSLIDEKYTRQNSVLTKEKLNEIGGRLEHSPCKSMVQLSQQAQVSTTTAWKATKNYIYHCTKLDRFRQLNIAIMREPIIFLTFFACSTWWCSGPKLTFFTGEAWFHLIGYVIAQNNRHYSNIDPDLRRTPSWSEDWCLVFSVLLLLHE
jgi:hypothetical protein